MMNGTTHAALVVLSADTVSSVRQVGVTGEEAETLLEWAREYGIRPALDHTSPADAAHWAKNLPHVHIGPVKYIPVR